MDTYTPSDWKVAAFGLLRLLTNNSNLNEDGFVALKPSTLQRKTQKLGRVNNVKYYQ